MRRDLMDQLFKRDMPRIREILEAHAEVPPEQIEKILIENGIAQELITRMKDKGGLLENWGKKKMKLF